MEIEVNDYDFTIKRKVVNYVLEKIYFEEVSI